MKRVSVLTSGLCLLAAACAKPRHQVMPCDQDLGFATRKMHLANIHFLDEHRQIDWFELYENLDNRRKGTPALNCIPIAPTKTVEQMIERSEHDIKELR